MSIDPITLQQRRSINQRIEKAGSLKVQIQIIKEWVNKWEQEQNDLIKLINNKDLCNQLKLLTNKKFEALKRIFDKLENLGKI